MDKREGPETLMGEVSRVCVMGAGGVIVQC